ncbi:helix-turn-helix domain-containing protein [Kitasatospora xanthocidica]|uniref:helix-turn-helix domain-containing protein n=1 Tax=Kitasatospora xanthocidica TaxID=83382 RepID=UPI0016778794|nr:helix-turn-helix transcriptional regulator [Kitasatospora xanthocidica]
MGVETDEFAAMLRELKERSGRSYGALATRLHVSTSTLHRYCNGAAVPAEYAPVERLARACGAGDDELVDLHRRWLLADAARRREAAGAVAKPSPEPTTEPEAQAQAQAEPAEPSTASTAAEEVEPVHPVAVPVDARRRPGRTRGRVLLSAVAVAAVAALVSVLALRDTGGTPAASGAPTTAGPVGDAAAPTAVPTAAPTAPGTTPTTAPTTAPATAEATPTAPPGTAAEEDQAPFHVNVLTNNWGHPCGQWFLTPRTPAQVPPPPDTAARTDSWAAAQHAIPAGHLRLELTAQGADATAVVLSTMSVRIVSTQPAPKWNAYTPGGGCGGNLAPASFAVDLDASAPRAVPVPGLEGTKKTPVTDFPYKVSSTDPQVIDVDATTRSQDVSWYLELTWSTSGNRHGTLTVNDNGRPFRTAGLHGAPSYFYNGRAWTPSPAED